MNLASVVIVILILVIFILALRATIKQKGKCAYCEHRDTCPFKNIKEKYVK